MSIAVSFVYSTSSASERSSRAFKIERRVRSEVSKRVKSLRPSAAHKRDGPRDAKFAEKAVVSVTRPQLTKSRNSAGSSCSVNASSANSRIAAHESASFIMFELQIECARLPQTWRQLLLTRRQRRATRAARFHSSPLIQPAKRVQSIPSLARCASASRFAPATK